MRIATALVLLAATAGTALAQYPPVAYAHVEPPPGGCIAVIHPTRPARIYGAFGFELDQVPVRLGESEYNHWGECWYTTPLSGAETLLVVQPDAIDGLVVLESTLQLGSQPGADGWAIVDLSDLHGGGHGDAPVELLATVPGFTDCYLSNRFELTVRSPDIDGDLVVDLVDIVLFSQALGDYRAYADLKPDGVIDLADIVYFSQALHDR